MELSVEQWRERGHFSRLDGREIFCMDSGELDKPAIFLIHGFPTSSWDWVPIWAALNEAYRLVALDMLGFGFSDKPHAHRYSIMEQADICEALLVDRKLTGFHVLAHDYGDTVAQELLARQNEGKGAGSWLSVCFLNGGLFPETHQARLIHKLLLSPLGPLINGSLDPISGAHMVARYREVISRDHFTVEHPTIGHYPQVEAPAEVVKAYLRFLRQL